MIKKILLFSLLFSIYLINFSQDTIIKSGYYKYKPLVLKDTYYENSARAPFHSFCFILNNFSCSTDWQSVNGSRANSLYSSINDDYTTYYRNNDSIEFIDTLLLLATDLNFNRDTTVYIIGSQQIADITFDYFLDLNQNGIHDYGYNANIGDESIYYSQDRSDTTSPRLINVLTNDTFAFSYPRWENKFEALPEGDYKVYFPISDLGNFVFTDSNSLTFNNNFNNFNLTSSTTNVFHLSPNITSNYTINIALLPKYERIYNDTNFVISTKLLRIDSLFNFSSQNNIEYINYDLNQNYNIYHILNFSIMDSGKLQAERDNIIGYNIDSLIIKGIDTITNQIIYAKIIFSTLPTKTKDTVYINMGGCQYPYFWNNITYCNDTIILNSNVFIPDTTYVLQNGSISNYWTNIITNFSHNYAVIRAYILDSISNIPLYYINCQSNLCDTVVILSDSSYIIRGNVFYDLNHNCLKDSLDRNISFVDLNLRKIGVTNLFTTSSIIGDYWFGNSKLYTNDTFRIIPNLYNYSYFNLNNCDSIFVIRQNSRLNNNIDIPLIDVILCPNMYVDISTPRLRRCFSNIYTINYKNNGTIASPNTYIDITLDRFLTVNSASKPYTNLGNNVLRFQLGNVDYLTSGSFTIDVNVRCDSTVLGQTHCVEAHIYPDTVCAVANYTGPVISATAKCKLDSVEFKLKNTGGNMQQRKRYIVIEDNLNRLNGTYQLNNGQQQLISIKADSGKTYGIIAEQDASFPPQLGDAFASAFIEGCNPLNNIFTTGIVTQYPEFDGEPYRSVDCQQNIGSFDPNDKTGYPMGISSNHNIEKNIAIDYHINFQNTGTDTAFKVVVVDTISKYLNINTIEPGASSHRYTFMRTDSNIIKFIFDSINLVDSNKNRKLSQGFVKFRIQQKSDNANGTKIYNQAQIYFDYNSPIFTNTTTHTIGEAYLKILTTTINKKYLQANIKVYPNPFRKNAIIDIQNLELQKTTLVLFDIAGKEILQLQSNNNQYQIDGNNLERGMYLFSIKNDQEEIATGKLMVQ